MNTETARAKVERIVKEANRSEVARRTGIHLTHVSRVLGGKRGHSAGNLQTLALYFGVSMDHLHAVLTNLRRQNMASKAKVKGKKQTA